LQGYGREAPRAKHAYTPSADAGLIEREPSDHDGRVARVRLTAEGEPRLALSFNRLDFERERLRVAFSELDAET